MRAETPGWAVHTWQMEDGLPNNTVVGVTQTPDGFLWIATRLMLAQFDGVRFDWHQEVQKEPTAAARAALVDSRGALWLARDPGDLLRLHDGRVDVITPEMDAAPFVAVALTEDREGSVWITCRGGHVYRTRERRIIRLGEAEGLPTAISEATLALDGQGRLWMAKSGELSAWNGERFEKIHELPPGPTRLAGARDGGLWVCAGLRLFKLDVARRLRDVGVFETNPGYGNPTALLEGDRGAVWMGTSTGGLFRYDGMRFERIAIPNERVLVLFQDREKNLWVGTDNGLNRVRPRMVELELARTPSRWETILSVCEDSRGTMWGVTHGGALVRRTDEGWTPTLAGEPWPGGAATCVTSAPDGTLWIGASPRLLYRYRDGRFTAWGDVDGMTIHTARALLVDSRGDLWIAGREPNALLRLRGDTISAYALPPNTSHIAALVEDVAGNIWVGAGQGVLLRVTGDRVHDETARTGPLQKSIRTLHATDDGSLWIGYSGGGLGRLDARGFARLLPAQGLPEQTVSQIVADRRGWFWFGGDFGLFKARIDDLDAVASGWIPELHVVRYGKSERLPNLRASFGHWPGGLRDHTGRIVIPMRTGLAVIDPDLAPTEREPPVVLVKRMVLDDRPLARAGGLVPVSEAIDLQRAMAPLRLPPDHRRVEFTFTALRSAAPENVSFRYRLDGLDDDWVDAGSERRAAYPRLPAGAYRFRVKAGNGDGVWNENGAAIAFTVAPFLWQTWWFQASVVGLFTSGVVAGARYVSFRRLRARLRAVEQQAMLDKERARIARDIHDDLGCGLTQVALVLEMARRNGDSPETQHRKIENCTSMVRQVAKSVDEIVWAINPRNDTVRYLIDYTSQFAVEFLHDAGIRCRVELPDDPPEAIVSPEARHNLYLVMKEALNNVSRHALAHEVRLDIAATAERVSFTVEDDGRGFAEPPINGFSDGLRNMRQRMEEIGGEITITSGPGAGTRVQFSYSWLHYARLS